MVNNTKLDFVFLPDFFFTKVMPKVQDIAELKVVLSVFYLIHVKQRHFECSPSAIASKAKVFPQDSQKFWSEKQSQFVTCEELLSYYKQFHLEQSEESLRQALNLAVEHGALLHSTLNMNGQCENIYFTGSEPNKGVIEKIKRGELSFEKQVPEKDDKVGNIFVLYEQNIGIITPIIAEELGEAERLYPHRWIEEAFKEAVVRNKRSWKYIARILERWANEGKDSGEHTRGIKKGGPDKYVGGKYGHLVKR